MEQLLLSFLGGIAASLTPCSLAGIPLIIGYIGSRREQRLRSLLFLNIAFIAGLLAVLAVLGLAAVLMGGIFGSLIGLSWRYVLGGFIVLLGLNTMELLPFRIPMPAWRAPQLGGYLGAFALGSVYAVVSSPCATPILAGILAYAALQDKLLGGMLLLVAYGLGQSLLLLGLGLSAGLTGRLSVLRPYSHLVQKISGLLLTGAGLYLLISQF